MAQTQIDGNLLKIWGNSNIAPFRQKTWRNIAVKEDILRYLWKKVPTIRKYPTWLEDDFVRMTRNNNGQILSSVYLGNVVTDKDEDENIVRK